MIIILVLITIILSYLAGSFPTAYLLGKLKGVDLRCEGSGNVGATNAFRVLGPQAGTISLVLDIGKGFLAVTLLIKFAVILSGMVKGYLPPGWLKVMAGISVIAGHNWTLFLKFKGGKGVATSAGVFIGLVPGVMILSLLIWVTVVVWSGYVSLGSILATLSLPIFIMCYRGGEPELIVFSIITAFLVVLRHRSNLGRLIRGEENKISLLKHLGVKW